MVKMRYHCEVCNKDYETEIEAKKCEEWHNKTVVIDGKKLIKAISQVYPCVKKTADSPTLDNILFEIKDGLLTLVAADGFILGASSLEASLPAGAGLMHFSEVKEFKRKLRQAKEVRLKVSNGLVFLIKNRGYKEEITLNMKGLTFLDWRKLIHLIESKTIVTFQAKAMKEALGKVKQDWHALAKLYIEGEGIRLVVEGMENSSQLIPATIKREDTKQAFYWRNLLKLVRTLRGEITLSTNGYSSIALFEQGQARWFMMPIFCQW